MVLVTMFDGCFRYIERFRRGEPMSREDRQRQTKANSRDFWWIDPANREREAVKKQPVRKVCTFN